jgi:hypothetical protein
MGEIFELENDIQVLEEKMIDDFNKLYDGEKELHDRLIKISTSHPDQVELLNFMVFLNDRLSTSQKKGHEAVLDTLTKIMKNKKELLKIVEKNKKKINKPPIWRRIEFKDFKVILLTMAMIILMLGLLFFPDFRADVVDIASVLKKLN